MNGSDFADFRIIFDEVTDEVNRARSQFLADHLENWFATIQQTTEVKGLVQHLMNASGYWRWKLDLESTPINTSFTPRNIPQKKILKWPRGPENRLGVQLSLFNDIANERIQANEFGTKWLSTEGDAKDGGRELVEQVFLPMARELRRYLQRMLANKVLIPASDRVVSLNHNSPEFVSMMEALDNLEIALSTSNDYPDAEDKDQRIAETSAIGRLLEATRVRIAAVAIILRPLVTHLVGKFLDTGIGKAANALWDSAMRLLGPF